jgi:hypothetical protein
MSTGETTGGAGGGSLRIVNYGMGRDRVVKLVRASGRDGMTVEAVSDYQAATRLKAGQADVAIGVCQSGAGGALAIPRALLGAECCAQLSTPSRKPTEEEIRAAVAEGKTVFGFALAHVDSAVPILVDALAC